MSGKRKPRKHWPNADSDVAFMLHQQLEAVLNDLERIDKAIPCETSRSPYGGDIDIEGKCIIVHRKDNLLRSIQTICRDHLHWGRRMIEKGWTIQMYREKKARRR